MEPSQPVVRYYNARRTRPWFYVVLSVVVVAATVSVWLGTDLLRAEGMSPTGIVTVDGEFDEQAAEPADDPIAATTMAMVGDSLTAGSADAIRYTLAAHGFTEMTIDGETSRR